MLACRGQRHPVIPRKGISGSQQGAIIIEAVKLFFCMFNFNAHTITHKTIEFLGSEMVQNLLSVTVLSAAIQNMIITKHNFFPVFIALGAI